MADQLERAFRECEQRGAAVGATALLDRVEARLNDETPSPFVSPSRGRWTTLPGPAVAVAAAAAVLLLVIGGLWLLGGFGSSEIEPVEEPDQPAPTTTVATTTTLPPSTTVPAQALEAPWVENGEIRIGSTVITKESLSIDAGTAVLDYNLTSLAPTGTAWVNEDGSTGPPAVLPERWELETADGIFEGTSSPTGRSVRFGVDEATTIDDIEAIRLVSWRTIAPVTYDFTIDAEAAASVLMPDGSAVGVAHVLNTETDVLVSFDITLPPDHWSAVPCGDIRLLGNKCVDPVPGNGWTIRNSDSDLQISAEPATPLTAIPLRYRRPLWVRTEGSIQLPLNSPDASTAAVTDFPDGFVQVTDNEAVMASGITRYGDQLLVSMESITRRGTQPGSFDPFMGGRWVLETDAGEKVDSIAMAFNDRVDGAFAIVFPSTEAEPLAVRLVEQWTPSTASGLTETGPVDASEGGLGNGPVDVTLSDGSVVRVDRFDIEGVGGYGTWFVPGEGPTPVVADVIAAFADADGNAVAATETWALPPRHFGLSNTGRLFWFWVVEEEDHRTFELQVSATVPSPVAVDVVIDLIDTAVQ